MVSSKLIHLRELKNEVAKLKEENLALRNENASLRNHMREAVLATSDLNNLVGDGKFVIVDGWNLILGAKRTAKNLEELISQMKQRLEERSDDFIWIILDGPRENTTLLPRMRITYTGGEGVQRADKMICDYLRMANFAGKISKVEVLTRDKKLIAEIEKIRLRSSHNIVRA
jgi:hypothetical protein